MIMLRRWAVGPSVNNSFDDIDVPNYKIFTNNRTIKKRASGGVAILVHNSLSDYITAQIQHKI